MWLPPKLVTRQICLTLTPIHLLFWEHHSLGNRPKRLFITKMTSLDLDHPCIPRSSVRKLNIEAFLVFTYVLRQPYSCTKAKCSSSFNLHKNRIKFPKKFFRCCSAHQHGRRDVTWKPGIERFSNDCWYRSKPKQLLSQSKVPVNYHFQPTTNRGNSWS